MLIVEFDLLPTGLQTRLPDMMDDVKQAWLHTRPDCPKFMRYHLGHTALPSIITQLQDNNATIKECDCIEWHKITKPQMGLTF